MRQCFLVIGTLAIVITDAEIAELDAKRAHLLDQEYRPELGTPKGFLMSGLGVAAVDSPRRTLRVAPTSSNEVHLVRVPGMRADRFVRVDDRHSLTIGTPNASSGLGVFFDTNRTCPVQSSV